MTKNRFTKQEDYDGINRYRINESNFIVEILDDGIPMHYSTIVNRLNEQDKTITRLEKENEQLKSENQSWLKTASRMDTIHHEDREYCERIHRENEKLKSELEEVVEVCRKYGIYKEELQYVLADYDKMLNENGERAIRYKYCVNSG